MYNSILFVVIISTAILFIAALGFVFPNWYGYKAQKANDYVALWTLASAKNVQGPSPIVQLEQVFKEKSTKSFKVKFGAADPFVINGFVFAELMAINGKGFIGVASLNNTDILHFKPALVEPFHLSFPSVFQHNDSWYMIPETYQAMSINLYKAKNFPFGWSKIKTILPNYPGLDSMHFCIKGQWYILTTDKRDYSHMLLTTDNFPEGAWTVIKKNFFPHFNRGGGSALYNSGKVILPLQMRNNTRGIDLWEIDESLKLTKIKELYHPPDSICDTKCLHHLSCDGEICFVDLRNQVRQSYS